MPISRREGISLAIFLIELRQVHVEGIIDRSFGRFLKPQVNGMLEDPLTPIPSPSRRGRL